MRTKLAKSTRRKALVFRRFMPTKNAAFFICLCAFCVFYPFLPLRRFYACLRLFLFLFAYVRFALFVLALRLSFLFAYVLFMRFMSNKRLSSSQTFLCAFKTVFVYFCLCVFCDCEVFFVKGIKLPQYRHLLYYLGQYIQQAVNTDSADSMQ